MGLINGNMMLGSTILRRSSKRVNITYELKDCISSNTVDTVAINSPYQTTIKSYDKLAYCGVQVLMGNKDISADVYDIYTGVINIDSLKSDVIIRAETLTTFEEASWYSVKCVAQSNIMNNEEALYNLSWKLGDTKPLIIGDHTYTVRICDLTPNRYQYVDDIERYSNMVLECVELLPNSRARNSSAIGNYHNNTIRQYYDEEFIPTLPNELRKILEVVNIDICYFTSVSANIVGYSPNRIFMPSMKEVSGSNSAESGPIFQYYELYTVSAVQKKKIAESGNSEWWYRTGGCINNTYGTGRLTGQVGTFALTSGTSSNLTHTYSSSSNDRYNYYTVTASKGIPIFWAW